MKIRLTLHFDWLPRSILASPCESHKSVTIRSSPSFRPFASQQLFLFLIIGRLLWQYSLHTRGPGRCRCRPVIAGACRKSDRVSYSKTVQLHDMIHYIRFNAIFTRYRLTFKMPLIFHRFKHAFETTKIKKELNENTNVECGLRRRIFAHKEARRKKSV